VIFKQAERVTWEVAVLYRAHELAQNHGIAAMDAIHIAIAVTAQVDEFVSAEKPTKPMFRVKEIPIKSLRESGV